MVKELRHQCRVVLSVAGVQQFFSLEVHLDDLELLQQPVTKALLKPGLGIAC